MCHVREEVVGTGTKDTINSVAVKRETPDDNSTMQSSKRTVQVNVKMSTEDFELLRRAADARWPEAILSNSGIILGLAKMAAKDVLGSKRQKARR